MMGRKAQITGKIGFAKPLDHANLELAQDLLEAAEATGLVDRLQITADSIELVDDASAAGELDVVNFAEGLAFIMSILPSDAASSAHGVFQVMTPDVEGLDRVWSIDVVGGTVLLDCEAVAPAVPSEAPQLG